MSKKQGVKKGSPQAMGYAQRFAVVQKMQFESQRAFGRRYMLDMVTVALGRLGYGPIRLKRFSEVLTEVYDEYGQDFIQEVDQDDEIWYSTAMLDRELEKYCGKLFVRFDKRYGFDEPIPKAKMTHAREIRIMATPELTQFLWRWKKDKTVAQIEEWLKEEVEDAQADTGPNLHV